MITVLYIPFLNEGLMTRPIAFPHFMVPAASFHVCSICFDETRKLFIRRGMIKIKEK
jgi:hypothetical protein